MWVVDLENAPERLRGTLARWAVEVRAGLYVGSAGAKTRESVWAVVLRESDEQTSAVMIWDATGPQGFAMYTHGPNRREIVDVDGLWLARFFPLPPKAEGEAPAPGDPDPENELPTEAPYDHAEVDPGFLEP